MARARYQVLVIPYCIEDGHARFCVFKRSDLDFWQFIAGGGEDEDASILESAKREAFKKRASPSRATIRRSTPAAAYRPAASRMRKHCGASNALSFPNMPLR